MSHPDFDTLLKQRIGLDAHSIGLTSLSRAVVDRQLSCGLQSLDDYWTRVQSDEAELKALIESVVVPETWFFRHPDAFSAMVDYVKGKLDTSGEPVRLLSLPCATGEEPASMVMALMDAGLHSGQFQVDAVDVSERALSAARAGHYGGNAFRGNIGDFRSKYFTKVDGDFLLDASVRERIFFRQGNLLDMNLLEQLGRYDVVFCRNLLIYFDRPTQIEAVTALDALLRQDGLLFVGPAESAMLLNSRWASLRIPHAFAFRKVKVDGQVAIKAAPTRQYALHARPARTVRRSEFFTPATPPVTHRLPLQPENVPFGSVTAGAPLTNAPCSDGASVLRQARICADAGKLAQAEHLCQQYVLNHAPVADVYYLLGLVSDASGQTAMADAHYRKALYLDPQHGEALVHLAVLVQGQGDSAAAERLHARARRALMNRKGAGDV